MRGCAGRLVALTCILELKGLVTPWPRQGGPDTADFLGLNTSRADDGMPEVPFTGHAQPTEQAEASLTFFTLNSSRGMAGEWAGASLLFTPNSWRENAGGWAPGLTRQLLREEREAGQVLEGRYDGFH